MEADNKLANKHSGDMYYMAQVADWTVDSPHCEEQKNNNDNNNKK